MTLANLPCSLLQVTRSCALRGSSANKRLPTSMRNCGDKGKAGSKGEQSGDGPSAPLCMDIVADYEEARNTAPTNPDGAAAMAVDGAEASTNARSGKRGRGGKDSWEKKECGGHGHCFFNCMAAGFILKTSSCTFDQIAPSLEVRAGDSAAVLPPM